MSEIRKIVKYEIDGHADNHGSTYNDLNDTTKSGRIRAAMKNQKDAYIVEVGEYIGDWVVLLSLDPHR